MKKTLLTILLTGILTLSANAWWWNRNDDITMLVVPKNPSIIRIAQDMAALKPILLVTYQQTHDEVEINAWNGSSWVNVLPEDYVSGSFFSIPPTHAVVIQSETSPAPDVLIPDGTWCSSANRIVSSEPRVIIHLLGRHLNLSYRNWKELAQRYRVPLQLINPGLVNVPWWHFRGDQLHEAYHRRNLSADLEKWFLIDITPPAPPEPVELEADPDIPPVELPAEEMESIEKNVPVDVAEPEADEPEPELKKETTGMAEIKDDKLQPADLIEESAVPPADEPEEAVSELTEEPVVEPVVVEITTNPFTGEDIPEAEVVEPKPKKPWWKKIL